MRALLPDPSLLIDMDAAAERLADAVARGETVGVFGDYDVDGACSAALMVGLLRGAGLRRVASRARPDDARATARTRRRCWAWSARAPRLIVCVDCGTAAAEALAALAGQADVIVLDHHKSEGPPPPILATVNPNRLDCTSGLTMLCAAGGGVPDRGRGGAGAAPARVLRGAARAGPDRRCWTSWRWRRCAT